MGRVLNVLRNPAMGFAYARWLGSCRLLQRPPLRNYDGLRVGSWINFTEYWQAREGIDVEDRAVMRACKAACSSDKVAIDVGANVGIFSLFLAQQGFNRVLAFEPVPFNAAAFEANLDRNSPLASRVELIREAVGETAGSIRFATSRQSPQTCGIARDGQADNTIEVAITTLDRACTERSIEQIGFLKIDVEGFERTVLAGAADLLRRRAIRYIFMEVIHVAWQNVGYSPADIYDLLAGHGMQPTRTRGGRPTGPIGREDFIANQPGGSRNVLWVHA
jgi:FkbM family methyltransferase